MMPSNLKVFVFVLLCTLMAATIEAGRIPSPVRPRPPVGAVVWLGAAHGTHGGTHVSNGNNQTSQENLPAIEARVRREIQGVKKFKPHEDQSESHSSQGGPHENQGRIRRETQSGPHEDQGGSHSSQGGAHENQGRVRRETQGGPHKDQSGSHEDQGGSHTSQGGPHENQGRSRRQVEDTVYDEIGIVEWIPCNATIIPRISCYDCNTKMICKPNLGGLLKTCNNRLKPYCNRGICSSTPSTQCAL